MPRAARSPAPAKMMVGTAREASANALIELRHLIRGINPPVLAERGLADAIRGLALDSPLSAGLRIDLPGRPERPVEAAAYFAVSELLTNVSKHADASRVLIDVRYTANQLRIALTDNGAGGADPAKGSGLRGVQRRLATFDGTLPVHSPLGGRTTVTLKDRVFNATQFVDALRRAAEGGTAMDPEVISKLVESNAHQEPLGTLTAREREVLELMAEGCSNAAVSHRLYISEGAVSKHIASVFSKLNLTNSNDTNRRVLAVLAYLNSANLD
ncbi:helix-turn-helix transcriptional regulator [Streptomyces tubercidicus]|uniref:helix-turn-helix transcriptional regulator n=1 Tax=Streptomyces tubercidicus TaxID=47759 RepID=UPI0036D077F2